MADVTTSSLAAALRDRYALERELGRGGTATVYLAGDLKHDRKVALKVLHPELAASLGPERFLREIRLTARLQHPHILTVLDSGETAGRLWFAMPYVEGESLRTRITRDRHLPLEEALRVTCEIADALDYAHRHGVIHRDIKPENILLSEGHALVADFGIAKAISEAGQGSLTETGLVLGTPAYMSPEQASGHPPVDGRSDLYSLGCVLYEMLAGEPPYTGPTSRAVLAKHALDPVPRVRTLRPTVPEAVEQAITAALAKVPADRFPAAAEFAAALSLAPAPSSPTLPATSPGMPGRAFVGRRTRLGLSAIGIILALAAWWALMHRPRPVDSASSNALAVLPFHAVGPDLDLWREGIVDLLSIDLDGAGGFRTVPPRTVLSRWNREVAARGEVADQNATLHVARDVGARYALTGSIVGIKGDVRLDGELYDLQARTLLGRVQIEGSADSVPRLVDLLSIELLRYGLASAGTALRIPDLSRVTTASLAALKAYLAGEQKFRRGQTRGAIADFQRAVEVDSTFALALYRLAAAQSWTSSPHFPQSPPALEAGVRQLTRLPRREAALLRGAWEIGQSWKEGLATLESLTTQYPDDPEAWFVLGDGYYHLGPANFIPRNRFREALRHAIALDPDFAPVYLHLAEDAFDRLDTADARQLIDAVRRIDSTSPKAVGLRLAYDLAWGSSAQRQKAEDLLKTASGDALLTAKHAVNITPDLSATASLIALAIAMQQRLGSDYQIQGRAGAIWPPLLRGRLGEASSVRAQFDSSLGGRSVEERTWAKEYDRLEPGVLYAIGYPVSAGTRRGASRWPAAKGPELLVRFGIYAAADHRFSDVERAARAIRVQEDSVRAAGRDSLTRLQAEREAHELDAWAIGLEGLARSGRGDARVGLRDLERAADTLRAMDIWQPAFWDFELGKRMLAEGDLDKAAAHFGTLHGWGAARFIVPVEYYLGRVAEAQGDQEQARQHYERLVRWWKDCDPELRPWRDEGRQALARLSREAAASY